MEHRLVIRDAGQYVVVEVAESSAHSYRGRLEVIRGDTVKISNKADVGVRLFFPEMRGMEPNSYVGVTGDKDAKCEYEVLGKIPGLMALGLSPNGCFSFKVAQTVEFGRYEYVVLFETGRLERPSKTDGFVSRWSHATGGSSSEFIIRRRR